MEGHMSKNNTTVIKTKKNLSFAERLKRAKNKGDIAAGLMLLPAVIMLLVVSVYPFLLDFPICMLRVQWIDGDVYRNAQF